MKSNYPLHPLPFWIRLEELSKRFLKQCRSYIMRGLYVPVSPFVTCDIFSRRNIRTETRIAFHLHNILWRRRKYHSSVWEKQSLLHISTRGIGSNFSAMQMLKEFFEPYNHHQIYCFDEKTLLFGKLYLHAVPKRRKRALFLNLMRGGLKK